jgi:hypothetical protein
MENEALLVVRFFGRFNKLPHFICMHMLQMINAFSTMLSVSGRTRKGRWIQLFSAINIFPDISTSLTKTNSIWLILHDVKSRFLIFDLKS